MWSVCVYEDVNCVVRVASLTNYFYHNFNIAEIVRVGLECLSVFMSDSLNPSFVQKHDSFLDSTPPDAKQLILLGIRLGQFSFPIGKWVSQCSDCALAFVI